MEYLKFLKSKKVLVAAIGVALIVGIAGFIFYSQKLSTYIISINPAELLPFTSHEQARMTICNTMKGELFDEICQKEFDKVGKNDQKKIGTLSLLLQKIENSRDILDYEKLLMAQAIFASLPTKDSPVAQYPGFSALLVKLNDFIIGKNVAYAQEPNSNSGIGEEAFREKMLADLKKIMDSLPKGDNTWIINVMVVKYQWINGVRQPMYSQEYGETFKPYPGVSTEPGNRSNIWQHVQSIVGSRATNQAMYGDSFGTGTGEMINYSFSMVSWNTPPYGSDSVLVVAEAGPPAKYDTSRKNFTESNYQGEDLLSDLLNAVRMPDRQQLTEDSQKKSESLGKETQTAWGSVDEWETAYEAYFWMHVQSPNRVHNFWEIYYNDEESPGQSLRALPLGEPVDLRAYFNTPGVRDFYITVPRAGTAEMPSLEEFLNRIDEYQANLVLGKPVEEKKVEEIKTNEISPEEASYRRWLECIARIDSTPGLKCRD